MSNSLFVVAVTSMPDMPTPNAKPPDGPKLTVKGEGSLSNSVDSDEKMIYLLAVLTPMLAKRMMKTTRMMIESTPPVMVVYSGYPLYLRKVVLGKRSKNLRNLLKPERQEVIVFYEW